MKIRPALLFCAAVVIAAAPVCRADRIPYPGSAKKSPAFGTTAKLNSNSGMKLDAHVNAGFLGDRDAAVKLDNGVTTDNALEGRKSESSLVRQDSFASFSEGVANSANQSSLATSEFAASFSNEGKEWPSQKDQNTTRYRRQDKIATSPVPESGTLAYLLLGVVALGLAARRRSAWTTTI